MNAQNVTAGYTVRETNVNNSIILMSLIVSPMTGLPVIKMDLAAKYISTVKAGAASQRISDVSETFLLQKLVVVVFIFLFSIYSLPPNLIRQSSCEGHCVRRRELGGCLC